MNATVNDNAAGKWGARIGTVLEVVGPGANVMQTEVRRPGERKTFVLPSRWLDREPKVRMK